MESGQLTLGTNRGAHPLPGADSLTDCMKGCNNSASKDMLWAFWNVLMAVEGAGFATASGTYE